MKAKKELRTISKSKEVEKKLKAKKLKSKTGIFKAKVKRYYNTSKKGTTYIRYYKTQSEMDKSLINYT